jgi:hypothetical protein
MGGVGKFIVGAALVGLAFIPGVGAVAAGILKTFLLTAGFGLASSAVASQFTARGLASYASGSEADPTAPLPVVYGTARVGLRYVDAQTVGGKGQTLYLVGALCHGSGNGDGIEQIGDIYFDGVLAVNAAGTVQSKWAGKVTVTKYLGSTAQSADATLMAQLGTASSTNPAPWTATSRGLGVAYLVLQLQFDAEKFTAIPQITVDVKGCKVYDPRTTTWGWSDNPALCILDYLKHPVCGAGIPLGEANLTAFNAMADYYDIGIAVPGAYPGYAQTTEKRFTCNGALDTGRTIEDNLAVLLSSCAGNLVYDEGQFRLFTRRPQAAVAFALTEDTIIGDWDFSLPGFGETANQARYAYVSAADQYQATQRVWPAAGGSNPYLTADGGFSLVRDLELPMTTSPYQAERIAIVELQESRDALTVQLTATEAALVLQVGDVVNVTHPTPGWVAKPFWVMGFALDVGSLTCRLSLVEYNVAAYTIDPQNPQPPSPNTSYPDADSCLAPSGLTLTATSSDQPELASGTYTSTIAASWTASADPYLDYYELQAKLTSAGAEAWKTYALPSRTDTAALIGPVQGGVSWDARLRAVSVLGVVSSWVTTSTTAAGPPAVTKTLRLHASVFSSTAALADYSVDATGITFLSGADNKTLTFESPVVLPPGVTVTNFRARVFCRGTIGNPQHDILTVMFKRVTDGGTATDLGGGASLILFGGEATYTYSLSEVASASYVYVVSISIFCDADLSPPRPYFRWMELEYTMPNLNKTV